MVMINDLEYPQSQRIRRNTVSSSKSLALIYSMEGRFGINFARRGDHLIQGSNRGFAEHGNNVYQKNPPLGRFQPLPSVHSLVLVVIEVRI